MGVNDAQEMLDAAKEQAILDERQIARLERRVAAVRRALAAETVSLQDVEGANFDVVETWKLERVLDAPDDPDR